MDIEFAVVGAGVMGLSAAWRLAAAGGEVVVFERFRIGHSSGSSHGATRIFRFAYDDPLYVRMARATLPLWRELEQGRGEILRITGGIDVGDPAYLKRCAEALEEGGAAFEHLEPEERRKRFGWLRAGDDPALWSPDTGVLAAEKAIGALADRAREAGAEIRQESRVSASLEDDHAVVEVGDEAVRVRTCILAAGAWAGDIMRSLGVRIPLTVVRPQVMYFDGEEDLVPFIHRNSIARYGVPSMGIAAGYKVGEHVFDHETTPEGRTFDLDDEEATRLARYVAESLPTLHPDPVAFETCLYTVTPDEDFVIDQVGPFVFASPCSGHGFKFAPLIGEVLSALALGKTPPVSTERFRISRFA